MDNQNHHDKYWDYRNMKAMQGSTSSSSDGLAVMLFLFGIGGWIAVEWINRHTLKDLFVFLFPIVLIVSFRIIPYRQNGRIGECLIVFKKWFINILKRICPILGVLIMSYFIYISYEWYKITLLDAIFFYATDWVYWCTVRDGPILFGRNNY